MSTRGSPEPESQRDDSIRAWPETSPSAVAQTKSTNGTDSTGAGSRVTGEPTTDCGRGAEFACKVKIGGQILWGVERRVLAKVDFIAQVAGHPCRDHNSCPRLQSRIAAGKAAMKQAANEQLPSSSATIISWKRGFTVLPQ
jgi:hypothetical protein